jgi:hypothetical protein
VVPVEVTPDRLSRLFPPEIATAPVEKIPAPAVNPIVALPPIVTGPRLSEPLPVSVNEAIVPLAPVMPSAPAPRELPVRLPPGPTRIVPLLVMVFEAAANNWSVAPLLTITLPVPVDSA